MKGVNKMASLYKQILESVLGVFSVLGPDKCESYFIFQGETALSEGWRTSLYFLGLVYCFFGLSAITARFFLSMENVVKHTRKVVEIDPNTKAEIIRYAKVWNFTIADISLLAFGTSFPQISLATIDALRNLGNRYAGGLGPDTLVGSAAFDLFPIHAVCVVVPRAGELKKISDIGVWLVELFWSFWAYIWLYIILEIWTPQVITLWEALLTVLQYGLLLTHAYAQDKRWHYLSLPTPRSERPAEWVPEELANKTIVDIFSIHSTDRAGINPYVIAFTALASGTSWPDLVASKIAAERQTTADSAIANITCSNSVNIYVGIGVPWLIDTASNYFKFREPLRIENAGGLSFSLLVFFWCLGVLHWVQSWEGQRFGPGSPVYTSCYFGLFLLYCLPLECLVSYENILLVLFTKYSFFCCPCPCPCPFYRVQA